MANDQLARNLYAEIAAAGRSPDFYRDWIGSELLPANLDLHNAALKAGRATGAQHHARHPACKATPTSGWAGSPSSATSPPTPPPTGPSRTLQNPGVLADVANITNAVRRYNVQLAANEQQERPARYEQSVPLPGGLAMPNPVTQATGIDKLFINSGAESEFAQADTWHEKLLAGFHLVGINLNPAVTALLSGGDWGQVGRTVISPSQNRSATSPQPPAPTPATPTTASVPRAG